MDQRDEGNPMSLSDQLAQFRLTDRPAIDTHSRRSHLAVLFCVLMVVALAAASVFVLWSGRRDFERGFWLATLRGRAALYSRDRAVISGGWLFDLSKVPSCPAIGQQLPFPSHGGQSEQQLHHFHPSHSQAAQRTCRETSTSSQATRYIVSQQERLAGGSYQQSAHSDWSVIEEPFSVKYRDQGHTQTLQGQIITSASQRVAHSRHNSAGKLPLIVCSSGLGETMGYCSWLVAHVTAPLGWPTLVYDTSGIAANVASTGPMTNMSVMTEERDLTRVMDYARKLPWVDTHRIVLVGQSQGGLVSVLYAARHPSQVWKEALEFPALNIPNLVRYAFQSQDLIPSSVGFMGFQLGKKYATDIWNLKPWDEAQKVRVPVLIEQGEADPIVDPAVSYRTVGTIPNARLVLIPNEKHGFSDEGRMTSAARIATFLESPAS
jgi:pimeloyl-ACP methyl ester carboxylesterase